ncbi:MAG: septum site-determining protein MinD [Roseiflexaceae bacterium]|jgi:septum site-determining protein MinD|nr:septum site-determining protein MinD [Chloroflexaceae bacterium]MCE2853063.1 septum site-determining protein MinD [Chloroflexaceae bacterium]
MAKVITITSGKGGVGKTTSTANLGTALAALGHKVAVVDADIGLRNLDVVMGLENRIVYDLVDVIEGNCRLRQALIKDKHLPELYLLPAAQTKDKDAVTQDEMIELVDQLRDEFEYVLIDCPAGIESGFKNAIAGADEILIVTTPEVSAVRDADRIIGLCEAYGKGQPRLILNRYRPKMVRNGEMMSVDDVLQILAIDLIGIIPEDEDVITSTNKGETLALDKNSRTGKSYSDIARRITGEEVPVDIIEDNPSLMERISNMFRGGR